MLPFERLRSIARSTGASDRELALEVAECFAYYSAEPAQLVMVARRLLAHRPACGPLWWVCAQAVAAAEPTDAARDAYRLLEDDPTAPRLSSSLPFPTDAPIITLGWPETTSTALLERLDLDVIAIPRDHGDEYLSAYFSRAQIPFRVESSPTDTNVSHLLIEASMADPTRALVPAGTAALQTSHPNATTWLIIAEGCLVPEKLFTVAQKKLDDIDPDYEQAAREILTLSKVSKVAGPNGMDRPNRLGERMNCPITPELLRI